MIESHWGAFIGTKESRNIQSFIEPAQLSSDSHSCEWSPHNETSRLQLGNNLFSILLTSQQNYRIARSVLLAYLAYDPIRPDPSCIECHVIKSSVIGTNHLVWTQQIMFCGKNSPRLIETLYIFLSFAKPDRAIEILGPRRTATLGFHAGDQINHAAIFRCLHSSVSVSLWRFLDT